MSGAFNGLYPSRFPCILGLEVVNGAEVSNQFPILMGEQPIAIKPLKLLLVQQTG